MPKDAPPNGDAPTGEDASATCRWVRRRRVSEMQAKLHRWAAADPGRRFDDLFNLVHDPATLIVAWDRVAGNRGANDRRRRTGDGHRRSSRRSGCPGSWTTCASRSRAGTFRPSAGAGTQDPQAGRVGEGASPRDSRR